MKISIVIILFALTSCSSLTRDEFISSEKFIDPSWQNQRTPAGSDDSSSCFKFISNIFKSNFNTNDYTWENGTLSEAQVGNLLKFTKKAGRKLEKGDSVLIWKHEMLRKGQSVSNQSFPQYVHINTDFERQLIEESLIDSNPREVLQIRLHYQDGSIVPMKKFYGNAHSVDFDKAVNELKDATGGNLRGIFQIEISHTHPAYAVTVTDSQGRQFSRPNQLSDGDLDAATDFMRELPSGMQVSLKAILPNGFFYQTTATVR